MRDFEQAIITTSLGTTSPLGQMAKAITIEGMDKQTLDHTYLVYKEIKLTGWDLVLNSQDIDILNKAITLVDGPVKLKGYFPDTTEECAAATAALWFKLNDQSWENGIIQLLSKHTLRGKAAESLIGVLEQETLSDEIYDRLALWRLQNPMSKPLAKRIDRMFTPKMDDPIFARFLVNRIVVERRLPHGIAWLAVVGKGTGFDIIPPKDIPVNALYENALRQLGSAHGRIKILSKLNKCGHLLTGKDMTAALRLAMES